VIAVVALGAGACAGSTAPTTGAPDPTAPDTVPAVTTAPPDPSDTATEPTPPPPTGTESGACADLGPARTIGALEDPALTEVSGAVAGRLDPSVVWVVEDSGNPADLVAIDRVGRTVARVPLDAENRDWEDLAAAPGPDGRPHLFVAEIGDNLARHPEITVLRLPEPPAAAPDGPVGVDVIRLTRPGAPADAEALIVDPVEGDVVIITKDLSGRAQVLVATGIARSPVADPTAALARAGELSLGPLRAVLAADITPDGALIALRTPDAVLLWDRPADRTVAETLLSGSPCRAPSRIDPFGEALALDDDGGYLLLGEGAGAPILEVRPGG